MRRTGTTLLVLAVLGVAAGAACGEETESAAAGSDGALRGRTFLSTAVTENGSPRALVAGTRVSLEFGADGRLTARAGCNLIGLGPVDTGGGTLSITGVGMTEMGCDPGRQAQDEWLAGLLKARPAWRLSGDELAITAGTTVIRLLDKERALPDRPLEGTTWVLSTVVKGDVSHHPVENEARLRFAGGRVTGSTGCNSLSGPAEIRGRTITVGPIGTTRRGCPETLAEVEQAVLEVLTGSLTYSIDSDTLRLRKGSVLGLDLRAG